MSHVLQLGPLSFPYEFLVLTAALAGGLLSGRFAGRKLGIELDSLLFKVLMVGIACARMAYVLQYREAYFSAPLDIFDLRDGGWEPQTGFIAAWMYVLVAIRKRPIVRKALLSAAVASTVLWTAGTIALLLQPGEQIELPTANLPAFDGGSTALPDFKGKPTVVNLWATWCPPCQREMPVLQKAQAEHPELHFVFLNQGESAASVRGFLAARKLPLRNVLLDPKGQVGMHFSKDALPTTLFFDANGRLVSTRIGELSRATLTERLAALSATTTP